MNKPAVLKLGLLAATLAIASQAHAAWASGDDLGGLARRLDERVSRAVDRIARTTRGSRAERRLLGDAEAFASRVRSFADRVDVRGASPSSRSGEVARLERDARSLASRIEVLRPDAESDWQGVLELLDRMRGALAERRPGNGRREPVSVAARVRGLAVELDEAASSARDRAERIAGGDQGPARDPVNDIRGLSSRARDLRSRIESPRADTPTLQPVDTRGVKPLAESVREVARQTEKSARRSEVLRPVWDDLTRVVAILDRMIPLL